jgi:hypothetical protein
MKKLANFALLPAILLLLLDACMMEDHQPSLQNPECQVLTFTVTNKLARSVIPYWQALDEPAELDGKTVMIGTTRTEKYTYDEQNRLAEFYTVPNSLTLPSSKSTYYYEPGFMKGGYQDIPLNEQGLVASNWSYTLTYNSDGFLTKKETTGSIQEFTIVDGNLVTEKYSDKNTPAFVTYDYEYDLSKLNVPNIAPQEGKTSKNLLTKMTTKSYDQPDSPPLFTTVYDYKYLFDGNGRPTRRYFLDTSQSVPYYIVADYAYTCR